MIPAQMEIMLLKKRKFKTYAARFCDRGTNLKWKSLFPILIFRGSRNGERPSFTMTESLSRSKTEASDTDL